MGNVTGRLRALLRTPLAAAALGGLVVGAMGWIAIAAGWIQSEGDEGGLASVPLASPVADEGEGLTRVNEIYRRAAPGVVFVKSEVPSPAPSPFGFPQPEGSATGSGFVIDRDGHVLTNAHVVEGARGIEVTLGEDSEPLPAKVVGKDVSTDLALLEVEAPDDRLHPLPLGEMSTVDVGDPVVAIGNPFGLDRTVTTGIVSALQRQIAAPNQFTISDVIQTDAAVNPGNSGGPLLDGSGRVIGVNSQIATGGERGSAGVAFAVPVDTVHDAVDQLLESGEVEHAFLGVTMADLGPQASDVLNLPVEQGALVQRVTKDGPADEAGVRGGRARAVIGGQPIVAGGDVIVAVDGEPVDSADDVVAAINERGPGDELDLELVRDGEHLTVTVTLAERPERVTSG